MGQDQRAAGGAETLVARQPILDRHDCVGYELLYRSNDPAVQTDLTMTSRTVVAALLEFGLDHLVGSTRAWINVSAEFLANGHHLALPPKRVTLELLEHETPTRELAELLVEARSLGYRLALDDYALGSDHIELVHLVDTVKVDLMQPGAFEAMADLAARGVVVLAEKVEERADYHRSVDAGATLFQGYYFAKPSVERRSSSTTASIASAQNLARLCDPELPFEEAVAAVASDPSLSTRMLVATNSSFYGIRREVSSVHEAVVFLGSERVRRLALLCVLDGLRGTLPMEVLRLALTRAELTRSIAEEEHEDLANSAYTCGLLSVLDVISGEPLSDELFASLGLSEQITSAIVHQSGPLGSALHTSIELSANPEAALTSPRNRVYQQALVAADLLVEGLDDLAPG